ncbi:MAG: hypothetical protein JSS98_00765 [Bacteroidetes bacterium]|nr:hypothetical protein [Bacteroidota bacterium]
MNKEHVISEEVWDQAQEAFSKNHFWIAYNTISYFLGKNDMYFFKEKDEAFEFSQTNISEYNDYRVIYAQSLQEMLRQIPYGEAIGKLNHSFKKEIIMNEKNFEYLKDNIKYLGFGEKQHDELEKNLKAGNDSFQMTYKAEVNKKPFEAVLQFKKPENSDMYFLNSYHSSLERTNGEKMEQTFYLNKGKGVTAKEAYNLLEGRSVYKGLITKAGEPYKAWIQLDFENKDKHNNNEVKQFHEKYGYDLKEAISKYKVVELDGGEKEKSLLQSLQKGNVQSVTIDKEGTAGKMFIEANPQFKTVTLYDEHMKRVPKETLEQYQSIRPKNDKDVKQDVKQDIKEGKKKSENQKLNEDIDLPKKKTSRRKGMSL